MNKINVWIQAFRLRTLPLSLTCIGMGSFLAASHHSFNWWIFSLTILTTIFLQILSNLANDYGDFIHGADHDQRQGPLRTVHQGLISPSQMKRALYILSILTLSSGILLLLISFSISYSFLLFLLIGLAAIAAAVMYTVGKKPYGYMGLGDISVFLFFGLVGVVGTYYLQTKSINAFIFLPACSCGFLAIGVLNINNIRDIESDFLAGKKSIPVRIGKKKSVIYHWLLLIGALIALTLYTIFNFHSYWQWVFLLAIPLLVLNAKAVYTKNLQELDPYLKQLSLTSLFITLLFGIGLFI